MSALLQSLIYTAQRAGGAIMAVYATDFSVRDKADASPVTAADEAAEKIILADLAVIAPGVPVVAEEAVAAGLVPVIADRFFLVDPLDGTREFVSRRDEFTVNVALIEDGEPVLGVVFAPARRELYWGDVRAGKAGHIDADPGRHHAVAWAAPSRARSPPAGGLIAVASRSHRTPETDAFLANYPVDRIPLHRFVAQVLPGGGGRGGHLSARRHHHGMGYRGRTRGAGRRRWARHRARGRAFPLRQAGLPQRQLRRRGAGSVVPGRRSQRAADYARLIAVPAIWGGTFVAGKMRGRVVVAAHGLVRALRRRLRRAAGRGLRARGRACRGSPRGSGSRPSCSACSVCSPTTCSSWARCERLPASRAALIIALNPVDHHCDFRRWCSRSA